MRTNGKPKSWTKADASVTIGLVCVVVFFIASGFVSYWNIHILNRDTEAVVETHQVITALEDVLSVMKDAETGQRGFLITAKESYLEPYNNARTALDERIDELTRLLPKDSAGAGRLPDMRQHIHAKMDELASTIQLMRAKGFTPAKAVVLNDLGKTEMDALRSETTQTEHEEDVLRDKGLAEVASAYRISTLSSLTTCILGILLSLVVANLVRKSTQTRQKEDWLQTGQVGLAEAMFGEQRVDELTDNILTLLTAYVGAQAGAMFVKEGEVFDRQATFGLPDGGGLTKQFTFGDGLLGQAAKDNRFLRLDDVPAGYLAVESAFLSGTPRHMIIVPCAVDGFVNAVLELGFIYPIDEMTTELTGRVSNAIAIAVRSAVDRANLQELLEETQAQGEELQSQSEELRVSNEELEEQGRALKASQARLEQQQAELEQTNAQLEEQTQMLENQRDDLNDIKNELEAKAKDLERTSRFKSDFLANMSHELRTPLNSSLILAKLLADNREGNLSEEQIKYAQTIQSAGNDLLTLISDILDLSKIEAGHMEVQVQTIPIRDLVQNLNRSFDPVAGQKGLQFETVVDAQAPESIDTDSLRLEQILRNLISNAIKFTEKGQVTLAIRRADPGYVTFAVTDSGIGISPEQHEMVFEAFRQADGTTNRKFGGTGLGLSISRELAHLLGGEISLESELGKGSTFSLRIPQILTDGPIRPTPIEPRTTPSRVVRRAEPQETSKPTSSAGDDRDTVTESGRLILVVEDDASFARILLDLAHEHQFKCIIANTAESALALAMEHLPSAVLLDVGLPDNSGLSVLDRLKHDARTRHIPVHVLSGSDYTRTAMALGAIGYMLKPVKREELIQAFEMLESRLTQRVRRLLVVEDDPVQLDSLRLLLGSRDVETVGVGTASECLEILHSNTFDCMVMDLSLPDQSGFSLLKTLSEEDGYSFPPVIVYTGRDLTVEEEQLLRRYSRSIIVKGAKSPERLLDEVTLFLHQVVADLPAEKQRLIEKAKHRDAALEGRTILIVEDDIRNVFALTSILEPRGAILEIARNGREALEYLDRTSQTQNRSLDLVLMDIMMPEMDGLTAMREIRKRPEWKKLPIIALTAKAMKDDQEVCMEAGANDYIAKPLDVEKLLSLIRVWMPR